MTDVRQKGAGSDATTFQKVGLGIAVVFFVAAVIHVHFLGEGAAALDPDVTVLTLAHWQLEDGFREGMDDMSRRFEAMKAARGVKVRVVQTTVPYRGYRQWMMTQLIGGKPADVLEISGPSHVRHQYFHPLSGWVGKPNPFNVGTPLEGLAWKDTFVDGMVPAFDRTYGEYFGVGTAFFTRRLHVNVDLVEKATGSRTMPTDLTEWLDICRQVKAYGERIGEPMIPIAVRGFDKATLGMLFTLYFSQTNADLNDDFSRFCDGRVQNADALLALMEGKVPAERVTAFADIIREIGQYFVDGFTAVDLEQSKFMFYSGKVAFFPEGTWNSYSLVQNSPFEVAVIPIPPIGDKHRCSKWFTGKVTESGVEVGISFGIPKRTKHFDLALELVQFMTSYEINQMTMNACRWAPAVKKAQYEGIVKAFQPDLGGRMRVWHPFWVSWRGTAGRRMLEALENIIVNRVEDPGAFFLQRFRENKSVSIAETEEVLTSYERANMEREMKRSQIAVGLLRRELTPTARERLKLREALGDESSAESARERFVRQLYLQALKDF